MMNLLILMIIFILISTFFYTLNFYISFKKMNNREKMTPFECGFDPFNSARLPFSSQFYLISIIFLIFDIEIIIFIPMIYAFLYNKISFWMNTSFIFILILLIGIYIEWKEGALIWMK